MPTKKSPRKGSLQFWPRKRVSKFLPRVNWDSISEGTKIKGFIAYKAGMASAYVKDNTEHSMTKGKKIIVPVTMIECPPMKIFSTRFYKNGIVIKEILAENLDKELKKKLKLPKTKKGKIEDIESESYDDIRVICYSVVKHSKIKKKPDLTEIGLEGSVEEKLDFVKANLTKEISVLNIFEKSQLVDVRGVTKGKGLQGPVKRFGITLKSHKSEKGRRRPGSLGPWHPARVTFRVPQAGQLGMFTRIVYNSKIIDLGKSVDKSLKNIKNYGNINTDYIIVNGSIQGPAKRQLLITSPLRRTKKQLKKNYELLELR
jgi:large subunit ribosomal protein L3